MLSGYPFVSPIANKHGKAKALSILAHKLGRAIYFMLKNKKPFDHDTFLGLKAWRGQISLTSNWNHKGYEHVSASIREKKTLASLNMDKMICRNKPGFSGFDWRSGLLLKISVTRLLAHSAGSALQPNLDLTGMVKTIARLLTGAA